MNINSILEATTTHTDILTDISMMTLDEYYAWQNKSGKMHRSDVYKSSISSLNRDYSIIEVGKDRESGYTIYKSDNSIFFVRESYLDALIDINDNTLYYKNSFTYLKSSYHIPINANEYQNIKISKKIKIKYMADIISRYNNTAQKNINKYPIIIQRKIFNNEYFTVRMESQQTKENEGISIAIINELGQIVALASNEWGATLIQVAEEYNGMGIGSYLLDIWTKNNPSFTSGGYTEHGLALSEKQWKNAVRRSLSQGIYSDYINRGKITLDKVKKIIKSAKVSNTKVKSHVPIISKQEPIIYSDEFGVIIFDLQLLNINLDEVDIEKYVYAHGFLRDNVYNEIIIYSFDYDNEQYRKVLLYSLLQISKNNKEQVHINKDGSDIIGNYNLPNISVIDGVIQLDRNVIDLNKHNNVIQMALKKYDPYGEKLQQIIEVANSKWDGEAFRN